MYQTLQLICMAILEVYQSGLFLTMNVLTLSNFNQINDLIFGSDIDYSGSLTAIIVEYDKRPQISYQGFSYTFTLQAVSITKTGTASLPTLTPLVGYAGYYERTIDKPDTYDGTFNYLDNNSDSGIFEGVFQLTTAEIIGLRRYLLVTARGGDLTVTISGADYPFGPLGSTGYLTVKVLAFSDEQIDINYWNVTLRMVEVV